MRQMDQADETESDQCDRCGAQDGRTIYVDYTARHGFAGLCDNCLDELACEDRLRDHHA
jgi:hypothetical protein